MSSAPRASIFGHRDELRRRDFGDRHVSQDRKDVGREPANHVLRVVVRPGRSPLLMPGARNRFERVLHRSLANELCLNARRDRVPTLSEKLARLVARDEPPRA